MLRGFPLKIPLETLMLMYMLSTNAKLNTAIRIALAGRIINKAYKNPAIIINGILFGLAHSLIFQNGKVTFNTGAFIGTGMVGYALAYITIKTRSILIPMLTHNLSNFLKNLFSMI